MIELGNGQLDKIQTMIKRFPRAIPRAAASAINRSAETARTEAVRGVRNEYVIQSKRIRETISIEKASSSNLSAFVRSKGRPRALTYFKVNPKNIPKRKQRRLKAQVKHSSGGGMIKGAFLARMKSGHLGVFNRLGKDRFPIVQRYGPSVPQMLENENVQNHVEARSAEMLEKRMEHELSRMFEGGGR
ncbi:phage tail protein [uncultured Anaeromusa sp.]|uniref:phage tail protein n=1 Tax=uncultured Anaeromusa sp. TaxID=673273 RepID=UPI0029C63EB4|nr:phage tail protein [uncultured Anaeromusa sp.]